MIWTILKADLLWLAITLPLTVGVQVLMALRAARRAKHASLASPAWARRELSPEEKFKLAQMRERMRVMRDRRRRR